jgi:predicted nucleotidyltransferase
VNIVFGFLPFEQEAVARATLVDIDGVSIPLLCPEDLIVMKAVAHRPRDLDDIKGILAAQSSLNLTRMLNWVQKFATALDMPEMLTALEALILKCRSAKFL